MKKQTLRVPEIIAELSGNHNGSLERGLKIIDAAAKAGATGIKLQTYTPDTITLDLDHEPFVIGSSHALWGGRKLYDLYGEAHTPWDWHEPLFARAASLGLDYFSTPFDETAVEFLESLNVSRYKIASIEIVDLPLIRRVAETGKPVVISTGASTLEEVESAVQVVRDAGNQLITLLVCSSSYPASPGSANLASMATLRKTFGVAVGYSDHTLGSASAVAAAVLGADMIEKHLTLDASGNGPDDGFSSDPPAFARLVGEIRDALGSLGSDQIYVSAEEEQSRALRPSLWVTRDVVAGEEVGPDNVASLRPSGGLAPAMFGAVRGKLFNSTVARGTPLSESILRSP